MVAQFVVSVRVYEHIERAVIEREPAYDPSKALWRKANLVTPLRMRSDRSLVKTADLHAAAEMPSYRFAKPPRRVSTAGIEIDMSVPAPDTRCLKIRHHLTFKGS